MTAAFDSSVDLVIPVYNEAHVLEQSIGQLGEWLAKRNDFRGRIVIVDNGSTDTTKSIARRLAAEHDGVELMQLPQRGRGRALRKAWTETTAEFSLYMDVDLSTDLHAVPQMLRLLDDGADLVTGSRLHSEAHIARCFKREVLSRGYNRLIRWVMRTRSFDDAQCGFKGVRIATVRPLLALVRNDDWFFDTELLVLAEYVGLKIGNLPITWLEDPDSRVNVPRTIWEDLCGLARLRATARRVARRYSR